MPSSGHDEKSVFLRALEIDSLYERAGYLAAVCAGNSELRAAVDELLDAHENAAPLLRAADDSAARERPVSEGPGTVIGPYKLLEQIGEGGFGIVFMAEQAQPVRRKVALKIIKPGMDTRQVIARFEAERQALAIMDHPHIAKVLDGGATPSQRPYFVMELVKGVPITEFCDQNQLTMRQRLELFISVCHAVQHAHQKGIIHRDLKPSNVLVAVYDTAPVVKVIDFGVAKAMGYNLTEKTLFTGFAQMIGTPLYMSPEQAGKSSLDIDTRSDIYSLGVLLYELLTRSTPFTKERFEQTPYDEICRIIREEDPPKPSTRLTEIFQAGRATRVFQTTVSALSSAEVSHAASRISNLRELDWVVMKALEKDRTRRYETAYGLAMDVQRYLADEPVLACPPSAGYRLKKFLRRHRGGVLTASLVSLVLVGGIVGTSFGLVRAERAWTAESERATSEQQAKETAQKRLAQIERGTGILNSVFTDLDPRAEEKEGRPLRAILAERLIKAAEQLEGETVGDPAIVAQLQSRLGESLSNLGMFQEAVNVLRKARHTQTSVLGGDHPDTLHSMNHLAVALKYAGNMQEALALHQQTLDLRKAKLGADHADTLTSMNNLAAAFRDDGKADLAIPLHKEALRLRQATLGPKHADTLVSMNNLALSYHVARKLDLAVPLYEETLALRKETLGLSHNSTLTSMNNLALGYKEIGKPKEALALEEETLRLRNETLGPNHPQTLTSMNNLALSYQAAGQLDLATSLLEECVKVLKSKSGPHHPDTLKGINNLAFTMQAGGKLDEALPLFEEVLKRRRETLSPGHPDILTSLGNLGTVYCKLGKLDQALPFLEEAAAGIAARSYRHAYAESTINNLIGCLEKLRQFDKAESWRRKWLAVLQEKHGPESTACGHALRNLAANLQDQQRYADAEATLRESLAIWKQTSANKESTDCQLEVVKRLIQLYNAWGKPEQAARWQQELDGMSNR